MKTYMKDIKSYEIIWNPEMNPKHSRVKRSVDEGDFQKYTEKSQPVSQGEDQESVFLKPSEENV